MLILVIVDHLKIVIMDSKYRWAMNITLICCSIFHLILYLGPVSITENGKVVMGAFQANVWSLMLSALYAGCTLQIFKFSHFAKREEKAAVSDDLKDAALQSINSEEGQRNEGEEKEEAEELEIEYRFYEMCFCGFLKQYEDKYKIDKRALVNSYYNGMILFGIQLSLLVATTVYIFDNTLWT